MEGKAIKVSKEILDELEKVRKHDRETYDDLLRKKIKITKNKNG